MSTTNPLTIEDVFITTFKREVPAGAYPGGTSLPYGGRCDLGIFTIRTTGGHEGHSFLGAFNRDVNEDAGLLLKNLKPLVVGEHALQIEKFWRKMWRRKRGVSIRAIGAVDVALWDLAGQITEQPIYRLLGGYRESVPAYASSAYLPTAQDYAEEAVTFRDRGWKAYKIHPHTEPNEDIEICRVVRDAVGPEMVLMLDAAWSYNYETAVRVGRAIEDLNFYWYEDPLEGEDIYGYSKLRQKLEIPIISTEYAPGGFYGMQQWILQGATDMLRGDVAVVGGITPLMKIANLADAFRMNCEIHHGGNSLNNVANLHATLAIGNCEYFEVLLPDEVQKFGLLDDIVVDKNGLVHAPKEPGLGYAIDWDLVKQTQISELR